jgi:signal transduction histidine kinase/ligand-binding sensor domain-containing protein
MGMRADLAWVFVGWLTLQANLALAAADPLLETLTGLSSEFVVTSWRMQQGLPSDRVRAVLQTRDSYIWVATFNGAAQFDGVRFRVFNEANTPALRNRRIDCLFEDAEGRLWFGSDTGEITWRDNTGFHPLAVPNDWPRFPIDRFAQSADGTFWVLNRDGLVLAVRNLQAQGVLGNWSGLRYSDIVRDTAGQIWAVRYGGVLTRLVEGREVPGDKTPEQEPNYRTIAAARRGGLWVRDGNRLRRWQQEKWVEDRGEHPWGTRQAVALYEAAGGKVWVGTRDEGAFRVAADGSALHINRATGLAHDLVSSISEDREGNLWIGSDAGGLGMLRRRALFMINPPDQWQHRPICSVSPSLDGGLWVGTKGAGVYKLLNAQFSRLNTSNNPTARDIRTIFEDDNARLWLGTEVRERLINGLLVRDRLGRFEAGAQRVELLRAENDRLRPVTRADTQVEIPPWYYAIYQSRDGALWLGSNEGLVCLRQDQWSRPGIELYRSEVRCITETPDGAIWIGVSGGGLARWQSGKFTQYPHTQALPYEHAWALLGDVDGSVWIGTPGAGLIRWREGRFVTFSLPQGLPSDFICSLQVDRQDHLWIGSYAGIFRVAKTDLDLCARHELATVNCLVLDDSDGLSSLEMAGGNQPSACTTSNGRLWFATSGGLAMVDPARIRTNTLPPPVCLEEVVVDGQPLREAPDSGPELAPVRSALAKPEDRHEARPMMVLRVPPGSGQIELRYTALSFCVPQRVRFRYRLEPVDAGWVEAGVRRSAYYSHLAPGDYRFEVIACNNDGVWNLNGAVVVLAVLPYFWQTWWFAPGCWLGGVSIVGTGVITTLRRRHRTRIEVLKRARLVEQERGRIARDLHDDLGSGLTDISTTSTLGQNPSVPMDMARQFFCEISQRSNDMVAALDEIVWAVNPKNDDLGSLATYFSQFTEHLAGLTSLRCRFEIPEELPRLWLNSEQRHSLFLAFKEALQNAVKHAAATSLRVIITVGGGAITIILEDDGRGFEAGASRTGANGLRNMRERLEQLGGRCEILTAPGKGTRVTFQVPVRQG